MKHTHIYNEFLDRCHSLAVLGGTFDPIHMGHLAIAEAVYNQLKPQCVLFMPCGQPAHKKHSSTTDAEHRFQMTALAISGHPAFDISRLELDRPGATYTIDTARALQIICPPGAEIHFIIGADSLNDIPNWRDAPELLQLCQFIVVPRPGYDEAKARTNAEHLTKTHGGRFQWLDGPKLDISSTDIRQRIALGQPLQGLVPKIVEDYFKENGLYGIDHRIGPLYRFEDAQEELRTRLSPKRFTHTMGVVEEAERLAIRYRLDFGKARWAALLHDCAKEYSNHKKHVLCQLWGIELDDVLKAKIDITHSLLSAESARRDFNIYDPEILQAIRYHTTGHKNMTMLDKIIALADYIEPYRERWGPLTEMRHLARVQAATVTNINKALILGTEYTIREAKRNGQPIHQWSLDALKQLKEENENGTD